MKNVISISLGSSDRDFSFKTRLLGQELRVQRLGTDGNVARASKLLKDDISAMGPVRLKDVEEAQGHLVNVAKDLAAKGEIVIAKDTEEDQLVY